MHASLNFSLKTEPPHLITMCCATLQSPQQQLGSCYESSICGGQKPMHNFLKMCIYSHPQALSKDILIRADYAFSASEMIFRLMGCTSVLSNSMHGTR